MKVIYQADTSNYQVLYVGSLPFINLKRHPIIDYSLCMSCREVEVRNILRGLTAWEALCKIRTIVNYLPLKG